MAASSSLLFTAVSAASAVWLALRKRRGGRSHHAGAGAGAGAGGSPCCSTSTVGEAVAMAERTPPTQAPTNVATAAALASASGTPRTLRRVCVFCGSSSPQGDHAEAYISEAKSLAKLLVEKDIELVYGGGGVGIMGVVARTVDDLGGTVIGVIPRALAPKESSGTGVQEHNVIMTETMHQRKMTMAALSDAFIALPGGFGTFEELMEMLTWTQLGIHRKTVGVLNVAGYYQKLLDFIDHAVDEGFIKGESAAGMMPRAATAQELLALVESNDPPQGYLTTWGLFES